MTAPLPGPNMPMPGPDAWPLTVPVEPCCGVLVGEEHDCWSFYAEAVESFGQAILLPPVGPVLTDPALNVWRPGPDMVEQMSPPLRWQITDTRIEVSL